MRHVADEDISKSSRVFELESPSDKKKRKRVSNNQFNFGKEMGPEDSSRNDERSDREKINLFIEGM